MVVGEIAERFSLAAGHGGHARCRYGRHKSGSATASKRNLLALVRKTDGALEG
jgi:hypothetical protein